MYTRLQYQHDEASACWFTLFPYCINLILCDFVILAINCSVASPSPTALGLL